jgi:hypothetical protein
VGNASIRRRIQPGKRREAWSMPLGPYNGLSG